MSALSGLADRVSTGGILAAAFLAAQLCLMASVPGRLFSENLQLVRHGIMVDETVCESAAQGVEWKEFKTRYFNVYTENGVDLNTVEARLRQRLFIIKYTGSYAADTEGKIAYRIDAICERAMELLDMHPDMPGLSIKIFKDHADLNGTYKALTGKSGTIRSFYAQDCRTIYTSEDNITDSVLAHEIAHAVVDTNYNGIPPPRVGEMLASYVDMHLSE